MIHWELWLRSQGTVKKFHSTSGAVKSLDVPRGYCFKYHKGGHCSGCSFKHSCAKCDGPHRAINCNFRAYEKKGPINPPAARTHPSLSPQGLPTPVNSDRLQFFSFWVYPFSSPAFYPMASVMVSLCIMTGHKTLHALKTYFLQFKTLRQLKPKLKSKLQPNDLLAPFPLHPLPIFVYLPLVWSLKRQRANSV